MIASIVSAGTSNRCASSLNILGKCDWEEPANAIKGAVFLTSSGGAIL